LRDTDPTRKLPAMRDLETIDSELRLWPRGLGIACVGTPAA
jgi:hypothetical protein